MAATTSPARAPTCAGSRRAGLITDDERDDCSPRSITSRDEMAAGPFAFVPNDEDIHTAVERRVTELAGAGRRQAAHRSQPQRSGRHRPAAVDASASWSTSPARIVDLQEVLLDRAVEAGDVYLPGYTHLQRAQPVLLAHHLLAHGWALARDVDRLLATRRTARRVAARCRCAGRLVAAARSRMRPRPSSGFARAFDNSLDAVE